MKTILNKNNTTFFFVSALLPVLALITFAEKTAMNIVIILGHAHFLIAYIYAGKYNKINNKYIYKFLTLFFIFGAFSYFVFFEANSSLLNLVLFSTLMFFVFHYFSDEFKISGINDFKNRKLGTVSVLLAFLALLLVTIFDVSSFFIYLITAGSLTAGGVSLFSFFKDKNFNLSRILFFIFFLLNLLIPVYFTYIEDISIIKVAGFIILFHYIRWYLRYFDIFSGKEIKEYLSFVFVCNLFFVLLFVWYFMSPGTGILFALFSPVFFYCWTTVHIIMSIRKADALI